MIAFRSDASSNIGQGHTIRCLKLAKAIRNNGNDCFFICRDLEGNLIKKIQQEGFAVHVLSSSNLSKKIKTTNKLKLSHADWLSVSWEQDAEETINAISSKKIDLLIVDHYALDKSWEQKLRPYTKKIMVIDDLADRKHDCDYFLDQNLGSSPEIYKNLLPNMCNQLYGPSYALLDPAYSLYRSKFKNRNGKIQRILIYFGSSKESTKLIEDVLTILFELNFTQFKIDIIINKNFDDLSRIKKIISSKKFITIHSNLSDLAHLMMNADLSIGSGGSTTWERCCLGLPTILLVLSLNQKLVGKAMNKAGAAIVLNQNKNLRTEIREAILLLYNNSNLYLKMSKKAFSICDGNGIDRVIDKLKLNDK